jgi:hypothetical protein
MELEDCVDVRTFVGTLGAVWSGVIAVAGGDD